MGRPGSRRTDFEGKLAHLLTNENIDWWAKTSGNNAGWDVHLFRKTHGMWTDALLIEVKTTVKKTKYFSRNERKQLRNYRSVWRQYRVPTWYAYRWVTQVKKVDGKTVTNPEDNLISVEVPAIIDRPIWEAAQARRAENKRNAIRNTKYEYLLGRRLVCKCGLKIIKATKTNGDRQYRYYRCPTCNRFRYSHRLCDLPSFRGDEVDNIVWEWVKSLLTDPEAMTQGLEAYQAEREKENQPIREPLEVVDTSLSDNRSQLERLLDLYLSGDLPKEMFVERRQRLEATIAALDKERVSLVARLEAQTFTPDHIQTIQDFAAAVAEGLEQADQDFETQRHIIETLDVQATLTVEDGKKVIYARCILDENVLPTASTTCHNRRQPG